MELNKHVIQNIEDVRVLFPYLGFTERMEWVDRFRHYYNDDFVVTVSVLMGERDI